MTKLAVPAPGTAREWVINLSIVSAAGVFLGVVGPFGSFFSAPLPQRVLYWVGELLVGYPILSLGVRLALAAAERWRAPALPLVVGAVVVCSGPIAALAALIGRAVYPALARMSPLDWYGQVLAIAGTLTLAIALVRRRRAAMRAQVAPAPEPPVAASDVLCLQMEDHYVRVHGPRGSQLVLTTLSEAIEGLRGVEGLQVHRSWWVARKAVRAVERRGRNLRLKLVNGLVAPVSRTSVALLRAAGWLEDVEPD